MGSIIYDFYDESENLLWNPIKPKQKINIKINVLHFIAELWYFQRAKYLYRQNINWN
jgi:hypothetical protein